MQMLEVRALIISYIMSCDFIRLYYSVYRVPTLPYSKLTPVFHQTVCRSSGATSKVETGYFYSSRAQFINIQTLPFENINNYY